MELRSGTQLFLDLRINIQFTETENKLITIIDLKMIEIFLWMFAIAGIVLVFAMCYQESKRRKIDFLIALLFCFALTPFVGYLIISMYPRRDPVGCQWCGNVENEADYCGICGKNKDGEKRVC